MAIVRSCSAEKLCTLEWGKRVGAHNRSRFSNCLSHTGRLEAASLKGEATLEKSGYIVLNFEIEGHCTHTFHAQNLVDIAEAQDLEEHVSW